MRPQAPDIPPEQDWDKTVLFPNTQPTERTRQTGRFRQGCGLSPRTRSRPPAPRRPGAGSSGVRWSCGCSETEVVVSGECRARQPGGRGRARSFWLVMLLPRPTGHRDRARRGSRSRSQSHNGETGGETARCPSRTQSAVYSHSEVLLSHTQEYSSNACYGTRETPLPEEDGFCTGTRTRNVHTGGGRGLLLSGQCVYLGLQTSSGNGQWQ